MFFKAITSRTSVLKTLLIIPWILLVITVAVILWGMNKSFDFSDEGFNMLSYTYGQEQAIKIFNFYPILGALFREFNPGIIFYRILRLALLIFSGTVFYFGFIQWIKSTISMSVTKTTHLYFLPIILLTTLLSYAIFYQILSYYSLTLFLGQFILGLVLYYLAQPYGIINIRKIKWFSLFFISFFLGTFFLVKFTTGILFFTLVVVVLLCEIVSLEQNKKQFSIFIFSSFILGAFCYGFCSTLLGYNPWRLISDIVGSLSYLPGHDVYELLYSYWEDLFQNFIMMIFYHPFYLLGAVVTWFGFRNLFLKKHVVLLGIMFILAISDIVINRYYQAGMENMFRASGLYRLMIIYCLSFIGLAVLFKNTRVLWNNNIINKTQFYSGIMILLVFPILCSFGTNGRISTDMTQYMFSWILIFCVVLVMLVQKVKYGEYVYWGITLLILCNVTSQIYSGYVNYPYRSESKLSECRYVVKGLTNGSDIRFDLETSIFLKKTQESIASKTYFSKGQPMLVLYSLSGLTYLLGGLSPGYPWYVYPGYKNNDQSNCYFIENSKMENIKNTIIILESDYIISKNFQSCLKTKGIYYPENYLLIDTITKPYNKGQIFIYSPTWMVKKATI